MMGNSFFRFNLAVMCIFFFIAGASSPAADELVRPTEIKSKRLVVFDHDTYVKLADLWKKYNEEYPSEYAYANWMYAARYAGREDYPELLERGLKKYPANPTLLYLKGLETNAGDGESRKYFERSSSLAPENMDPWFALVPIYMNVGDDERLELALKKILESGIITDEVMDYNYNILNALDKDAILITNGDNDTYPGWILQEILGIRKDISIINRSLLNTDWYPMYVIEHGAPRFIEEKKLEKMREEIMESLKMNDNLPVGGPFSDTLIVSIIESAQKAGRPVYFANTLYFTDRLREIADEAYDLGLYRLVTTNGISYEKELTKAYRDWLDNYKTEGLKSWRLRYSSAADAGRGLVLNYGYALAGSLESLKKNAPGLRRELFNWYIENVEPILSERLRGGIAQAWCNQDDIAEIKTWCKKQGIK